MSKMDGQSVHAGTTIKSQDTLYSLSYAWEKNPSYGSYFASRNIGIFAGPFEEAEKIDGENSIMRIIRYGQLRKTLESNSKFGVNHGRAVNSGDKIDKECTQKLQVEKEIRPTIR